MKPAKQPGLFEVWKMLPNGEWVRTEYVQAKNRAGVFKHNPKYAEKSYLVFASKMQGKQRACEDQSNRLVFSSYNQPDLNSRQADDRNT